MESTKQNCIIALGTGTSTGIPIIGCHCLTCKSSDSRDQRLRSSILIQTKSGKNILVDTTPDLRTQLLLNKITHIDFVIMTHDHADHLHGIDDLRPLGFRRNQPIPIYTTEENKLSIEKRFEYIFGNNHHLPIGGGIPKLTLHQVQVNSPTIIDGEEFTFFKYPHGFNDTLGFVHQGFAYIVDCFELPKAVVDFLAQNQLKLLIIDCVQKKPHSTHLNVEKSFNYIKEIDPLEAGLIHMGHDLGHVELEKLASDSFSKRVFPLYDTQKLFY